MELEPPGKNPDWTDEQEETAEAVLLTGTNWCTWIPTFLKNTEIHGNLNKILLN